MEHAFPLPVAAEGDRMPERLTLAYILMAVMAVAIAASIFWTRYNTRARKLARQREADERRRTLLR